MCQSTAWLGAESGLFKKRGIDMTAPRPPMLATALVASVADPDTFRSGRLKLLGLDRARSQQHFKWGQRTGISKQGDHYLRSLLTRSPLY